MYLSKRLKGVAGLIPKCDTLADIGTDHGYIPAYALMNGICISAIASDINEGPLKIAEKTFKRYGIMNKVELRQGSGLSVLNNNDADVIVIAGMGGNLIANIINDDLNKASGAKCLILQPVQYPEILRYFLAEKGFNIEAEDVVMEDNKYYHIIKASKGVPYKYEKDVYYYTGITLLNKKHPILRDYVEFKIQHIEDILSGMPLDYQGSQRIKLQLLKKQFEDVLKCL